MTIGVEWLEAEMTSDRGWRVVAFCTHSEGRAGSIYSWFGCGLGENREVKNGIQTFPLGFWTSGRAALTETEETIAHWFWGGDT